MATIQDVRRRRNATLISARGLLLHARAERGPDGQLTPDEDAIFGAHIARLRELDSASGVTR